MKNPPRKVLEPGTSAATSDRTVLLFDIDGTLVLTGGAGGRSLSLAFEELFGIRDAFRGIAFGGRTDAWLVAQAAQAHGIPPDAPELAQLPARYFTHLSRELHETGSSRKGIMPGVRPLLEALSARDDVFLALLTGNYETGARMKLEHFDLWGFFACGAFGDTVFDRNHLLPDAISQVRACGGPVVPASQIVIIGDTPLDVACARAGGARAIAVATGSHSADELIASGADVVYETLADTADVLSAIHRLGRGENRPA
jgi:phosphoglycolate phosphatase-like HAD superfamily hydrolase